MTYSQPFPLSQPPPIVAEQTFGPDLAVRLICPHCRDPHPDIEEDFCAGDLICASCGLILGDRIVDTRSEWRTFTNDDGGNPSRVGVAEDPIIEGINELSTVIGVEDGGSGLARELQRATSRSQNSRSQRKITRAFRDISNWCDQFSLSKDVGDIAKQLYKRLYEEKLLRSKPFEAVLAACVFIACRQARVPRTFREICSLTHVTKKALSQCCKALELAFNLKQIPLHVAQSSESSESSASPPEPALPSNPEALVSRYCNQLDLPYYVEIYCADVIITARELGIAEGRKPASIVGGAIYFTSRLVGQERSPKEISDVTGVSEGMIELVFHSYRGEKNNLVKEGWVEEGRAQLERLYSPDSDGE